MSLLGNLIWLIFGGLISALGWALAGLLLCLTIIGIPFGRQCFKIAALVALPFGKRVTVGEFGFSGLIGNILWVILLGWELMLLHLIWALLLAITVVGIPFALQHVKFARLALLPFGARVGSSRLR